MLIQVGAPPGAPFRHFLLRDALKTAMAGEAQRRFRAGIDAALAEVPDSGRLARFRALGSPICAGRCAGRFRDHLERPVF